MSTSEGKLRAMTVDELRALARERNMSGVSEMKKEELVAALSSETASARPADGSGLAAWARDRSLGLFFVSMFLASWVAQLVVEWQVFADEQREHGGRAVFWSADFWETFWQSTLENWQSEFLQLAAFTIAATYFVMKGSSESPDSDERVEAKIDALLEQQGLDPVEIENELPPKYRKTR